MLIMCMYVHKIGQKYSHIFKSLFFFSLSCSRNYKLFLERRHPYNPALPSLRPSLLSSDIYLYPHMPHVYSVEPAAACSASAVLVEVQFKTCAPIGAWK